MKKLFLQIIIIFSLLLLTACETQVGEKGLRSLPLPSSYGHYYGSPINTEMIITPDSNSFFMIASNGVSCTSACNETSASCMELTETPSVQCDKLKILLNDAGYQNVCTVGSDQDMDCLLYTSPVSPFTTPTNDGINSFRMCYVKEPQSLNNSCDEQQLGRARMCKCQSEVFREKNSG
jgi:hypothetical protein